MLSWPLLHKNKVEDSKVSVPVASYAQSENEVVKALAQKVGQSQTSAVLVTDTIIASRPLGNIRNCLPHSEEGEDGAYAHIFLGWDFFDLSF